MTEEKQKEEYSNFIRKALSAGFTDDQVDFLEEFTRPVCDLEEDRCEAQCETDQYEIYKKRAMEWIFFNGKLTGAEGKKLIEYIFDSQG